MLNIVVTGGAGFIGTRLVERLASFASVTVLDSLDSQIHDGRSFSPQLEAVARCVRVDIRDDLLYGEVLEDVDVVVHFASQTGTGQSMYNVAGYVSNNAFGTALLLEAILRAKRLPARIILASSRAVYGEGVYEWRGKIHSARRSLENLKSRFWEPVDPDGNKVIPLPMRESHPADPISLYGLTKLWQEQLVQNVCDARSIDYAILRFQNVYGPGQAVSNPYTGIVGTLARCILANEPIELFEDGLMTRDFLFVDDAVAAVEAVVRHADRLQGIYNVGSGVQMSLAELAEKVALIAGKSPKVRYSGRFRIGDIRHALADTTRFRATFYVVASTPIEEGLAAYLGWFARQPAVDMKHDQSALMEMASHGLLFQATEKTDHAADF